MINRNAIKAVFEGSLKLKSTESFLVVTDKTKEHIGRAFYEYASGITGKTDIVVIRPAKEHAEEPPHEVAEKMLRYDVELLVTEKSLTHTRARRAATAKGARIATMPMITEDIANRCLDIDYEALRKRSREIYRLLAGGEKVRVSTKIGTDITFFVGNSGFFGQDGGSYDTEGAYGNLPEGEVSFAPSACEGVFIVDASFPELGKLDSPITFKVKNGAVSDIAGDGSGKIMKRLDAVGPRAYIVAELGIGLNPKAKVIGNILEDEKVIGTVHIAVGNNCSYGLNNDVPLHLDGVIKKPSIYVDGKPIMVDGEFCQL
ncbi:MAG: aminopeptidase [Candidatus Omnitrophica bacterium]|nr:aminopeptidase [Candidatus Omnitrophota bacterium]